MTEKYIAGYVEAKRARRRSVLMLALTGAAWIFVGTSIWREYRREHPPAAAGATTAESSPFGITSGGMTVTQVSYVNPATDADLGAMFKTFNREYFGGELPAIPVAFKDRKGLAGFYQPSRLAEEIGIVPKAVPTTLLHEEGFDADGLYRRVLLHEMAHAYVAHHFGDTVENHGAKWKAEMRHLAGLGALDELLWTKADAP